MTIAERIDAFKAAFPQYPAAAPWLTREQDHDAFYGVWVIGNNYGNETRYYGAYPRGYLKKVMALFPERRLAREVLHAFSGSVPKGSYMRCDSNPANGAEYCCQLQDLRPRQPFTLIIADPPYTAEDAKRYETPMINRRVMMAALAGITAVGGFLVWLDEQWPMHRKAQWATVGRVLIQRSTNHRVRVMYVFQRVDGFQPRLLPNTRLLEPGAAV